MVLPENPCSHDLPSKFTLSPLFLGVFVGQSLEFEPFNHWDLLLVVLLLLCEVLEFAAEHTPHHVSLQVVDVVVLELLHHLLYFAVCDQAD